MKIIQMSIGQTSPEDFQVFGLGDDGMLYEWQFGWTPYALVTDKAATYARQTRCPADNPAYNAKIEEAYKDPERYTVEWVAGSTPGWKPCADTNRAPQKLEHPLKP